MPTHPLTTTLLPVTQIHPNPDQPRKHFDPDALKDLKDSIQERGLINPISVMQRGEGDYLIIAGERRYRACCDLGWTDIDARIWPATTTPQEVELLSLVENVQRTDLTPLEVANGFKLLSGEPYKMTQEAMAKQSGKSRGTISQYLMIAEIPRPVQEIANRLANLELAHLLQICRLKTPEDQIALAKEASEKDLTVKELKALVDKKLKAASPGLRPPSPQGRGGGGEAPSDPLESLWPALRDKVDPTCQESWAVVYTPFTFTFRKEWGWAFGLIDKNKVSPERVAAWLEKLARGIREANPDLPAGRQGSDDLTEGLPAAQRNELKKAEELARRAQEMAEKYKTINPMASALWLPRTPQEAVEMKASPMSPRLPNTPAEWGEVEALAPRGPGAVYQWMLGPSSYWTKKAAQLTWKDLGYSDPITGCRKLIETLRQAKSVRAQEIQEIQKDVEEIDPKVQAMIDRVKARRGIQ